MIIQRIVELLNEDDDIYDEVGDSIYPVEWPDAPTYPLIVVQRVGGAGETDMNGEAGIEHARVQIDVYSKGGYAKTVALGLKIRRKLHGFKGGPSTAPCAIDRSACINALDLPVNEVKQAGPRLRRRCLEFSVWTREI